MTLHTRVLEKELKKNVSANQRSWQPSYISNQSEKSTTHVQNSYSTCNIYGKFGAWECSGFLKNKKSFTLQTDKLTADTF